MSEPKKRFQMRINERHAMGPDYDDTFSYDKDLHPSYKKLGKIDTYFVSNPQVLAPFFEEARRQLDENPEQFDVRYTFPQGYSPTDYMRAVNDIHVPYSGASYDIDLYDYYKNRVTPETSDDIDFDERMRLLGVAGDRAFPEGMTAQFIKTKHGIVGTFSYRVFERNPHLLDKERYPLEIYSGIAAYDSAIKVLYDETGEYWVASIDTPDVVSYHTLENIISDNPELPEYLAKQGKSLGGVIREILVDEPETAEFLGLEPQDAANMIYNFYNGQPLDEIKKGILVREMDRFEQCVELQIYFPTANGNK